jgi:hypothetical protein
LIGGGGAGNQFIGSTGLLSRFFLIADIIGVKNVDDNDYQDGHARYAISNLLPVVE